MLARLEVQIWGAKERFAPQKTDLDVLSLHMCFDTMWFDTMLSLLFFGDAVDGMDR